MVKSRIKQLRKATGFSQEKFAKETGISFSLLCKIETGHTHITREVENKIIARWGVAREWFLQGRGQMNFTREAPPTETENQHIQDLRKEVEYLKGKLDEAMLMLAAAMKK